MSLSRSLLNAFQTRWKIWNYLHSLFSYPAVRVLFATNHITWGNDWQFFGIPIVQKHQKSVIAIGNRLQLRSSTNSNPFGINHPVILCTFLAHSILKIGDDFRMSGGAICATEKITIGHNVTIGANTIITDSNFHPSQPDKRLQTPNQGQSSPVTIENNVFIGANCFILHGVTLGEGCVVGTGSVVTTSVQPGTIVFGNPARLVGKV